MTATSQPPEQQPPDKWAPWNALRGPVTADRWLRAHGIELHAGSTAEEIQRAVNIYRSSW